MKKLIILSLVFIVSCAPPMPIGDFKKNNEYVVLLHGLARSSRSMKSLANYLSYQGYTTINLDYPATNYPIDWLVDFISSELNHYPIENAKKIHFVTHSMGGILVRWYLKYHDLKNMGTVVMLSPPNQGSELVNIAKDNGLFQFVMGPAAQQLGIEPTSVPNQLGAVRFKLGIITGNSSINPLLSYLIPGEDDGKVSVERAKVEGMADFLVMPHSHPFIMNSTEVMKQVACFLTRERFCRDSIE